MSEPRLAFEEKPDLGEYVSATGSAASSEAPAQQPRLSLVSVDTEGNDSSDDDDDDVTQGLADESQVNNNNNHH